MLNVAFATGIGDVKVNDVCCMLFRILYMCVYVLLQLKCVMKD